MQQLADVIIPMVKQFFDASYATHRAPSAYYYVANGVTGQEACTDPATGQQATYSSQSYEYCSADNDVYLGQDKLWFLYSNFGAVSVAAGIAHEDTHEDQNFVGVPQPQTRPTAGRAPGPRTVTSRAGSSIRTSSTWGLSWLLSLMLRVRSKPMARTYSGPSGSMRVSRMGCKGATRSSQTRRSSTRSPIPAAGTVTSFSVKRRS
jgi:hypothetical protein